MLYRLLLYLHIVSVVLSIGPFVVLIPMAKKLGLAERAEQQAYLAAFRFVIRLAKHAGHVLVASGILLVMAGNWPWTTSWIAVTTLILLSSLWFLARAFSPTLRTFDESGQDRAKAAQKLVRAIWIYLAILLTMLWFMVTKPVLW
jgi:uncharacterized membrane protein